MHLNLMAPMFPQLDVNIPEGWWKQDAQLDLDFANRRAYNKSTQFRGRPDSILTYSSPSPKMVYGDDGVLGYAPHNLLLQSQTFDTTWNGSIGGTGVAPSVTANAGDAPDGTATADRVQFSLAGGTASGDFSLLRQGITTGTGQVVSVGIWLKSYDSNSYAMLLTQPDGNATAITVTPTWQLFSVSGAAAAGSVNYGIRLRGGQTPTNSNTADVLMWGARLHYGASALTYIPTTTAAVYSLPLDYDPVTHAPLGVLIEEQRTNLLTYSQEFDNAAWTKTACSITANAVAAPDGTTTADKMVESATNAYHNLNRALGSTTPQQTLAFSVFAKASERSDIFLRLQETGVANFVDGYFDLSDQSTSVTNGGTGTGATATIQDVGGGWYRCVLVGRPSASTGTGTSPAIALTDTAGNVTYSGDGTSGLYLWGAQLEAGAFPTSYIPTVASQVTRAADQVSILTSAFGFSATEGTVSFEGDRLVYPIGWSGWYALYGSSNNYISSFASGGGGDEQFIVRAGGVTTQLYSPTGAIDVKAAHAYKDNDAAASLNGAAAVSDASVTVPSGLTTLRVGWAISSSTYLNGHIKRLTYWNTRKTDAELQGLTI